MGSKGLGALARMACSIKGWKSTEIGFDAVANDVFQRNTSLESVGLRELGTESAVTVMRFCVSVPVLSVHSTLVAPSVSIALMWRVSTPSRARRRAPMAGNRVSTTEYSSGRMDMARAMLASTAGSHSPVRRPSVMTMAVQSTPTKLASTLTSRAVCCCKGVSACCTCASAKPIWPIWLRMPVAVTCACPLPRTTNVPPCTREAGVTCS